MGRGTTILGALICVAAFASVGWWAWDRGGAVNNASFTQGIGEAEQPVGPRAEPDAPNTSLDARLRELEAEVVRLRAQSAAAASSSSSPTNDPAANPVERIDLVRAALAGAAENYSVGDPALRKRLDAAPVWEWSVQLARNVPDAKDTTLVFFVETQMSVYADHMRRIEELSVQFPAHVAGDTPGSRRDRLERKRAAVKSQNTEYARAVGEATSRLLADKLTPAQREKFLAIPLGEAPKGQHRPWTASEF